MLKGQSIKNKLIGLTLLGLLTSAVVGIYSYRGIVRIDAAMTKIAVDSAVMRNHMYADMMHDALNSDVNAAILASENIRGIDATAVESELKEHSQLIAQALEKNQKLVTDPKTLAALQKAIPALNNYIAAAAKIVATVKTDRPAAINLMGDFHEAFVALETEMEGLSQLIEANVAATQKHAQIERGDTATVMLLILALSAAALIIISYLIITSITVPLGALVHTSDQMAQGNLTRKFDSARSDEIGCLSAAMEKMRTNLVDVISQIGTTTTNLSESADQILNVTREVANRMALQGSETEQVAAAMNEMTATVHEVSKHISATDNSAQQAAIETETGGVVVTEAVESIKVLAKQIADTAEIINRVEHNTHNISSVLDVIRTIAEQTNLLALNAAIEAARAGEQGRGFAVVADEVRTLASRTQESTGEINEMISQLQQGSKLSVNAMSHSCEQADLVVSKAENAGKSLNAIATTVHKISELSAQIATAAEQQTAVSEEINRSVDHINQATLFTSETSQKTSDIANRLVRSTGELQQLVNRFRV